MLFHSFILFRFTKESVYCSVLIDFTENSWFFILLDHFFNLKTPQIYLDNPIKSLKVANMVRENGENLADGAEEKMLTPEEKNVEVKFISSASANEQNGDAKIDIGKIEKVMYRKLKIIYHSMINCITSCYFHTFLIVVIFWNDQRRINEICK